MENPVVIVGGWLSTPDDYRGLATHLAQPPYNRIVYICDIGRGLWLSLRDPEFHPAIEIVARTVELAMQETGATRIDMIGHSAGGRIARANLGHASYGGTAYNGQRHVANFTTLGTAHATVEIYVAQFGKWVNEMYPGAYYSHIAYCSVAGESVQGRRIGSPEQMLAFRSYELTCGDGNEIGDGVIPMRSCFLQGADNLVLRGVRHAPYNAPRTWYGAPEVVELWYEGGVTRNEQRVMRAER
ncbi:MAG: lipase [Chloroflexaceae bacterium]|jgi:hypothetical protein|nr:lipase [Chloroflexaceae bacterium]